MKTILMAAFAMGTLMMLPLSASAMTLDDYRDYQDFPDNAPSYPTLNELYDRVGATPDTVQYTLCISQKTFEARTGHFYSEQYIAQAIDYCTALYK